MTFNGQKKYSQTQLANARQPQSFTAIDLSSEDFEFTGATEQKEFRIYVGVSGDVNAVGVEDSDATLFKNVPVGWMQGIFKKVEKDDTDAEELIAGR